MHGTAARSAATPQNFGLTGLCRWVRNDILSYMMKTNSANHIPADVSRRDFILSGLAASCVAGCRTADLFGRPELTFGVVSDIHVTSSGTEARYEKALRIFKDRGADAVMVCGDLADCGTVGSLEHVRDTWRRVFGGAKTVPLLCTGNHD